MEQKVATIARDENLDLFVDTNGQLAMVEGQEAYAQIINSKMRTTLGELQLAMEKGIPYFQTVFGSSDMIPVWKEEVNKMLLGIPFVKEIISFDCNIEDDVLKYVSEIRTDEGVITING